MFKKLKFKSIQSNILLGIISVVALILVMTVIMSFVFTKSVVEDTSEEYTIKLINQVERNIDYYLKEMNNISNAISYNFDVSSYYSDEMSDELYERIKAEIEGQLVNRNDIASIAILGHNGNNILTDDRTLKSYADLNEKDWYEKALNNEGKSFISGSHVQNIYEDEYRWVITLSRELLDLQKRNSIGILAIDLNYKIIDEICNEIQLGKRGYIYIIDSDGEIVYHPNQRLIHSKIESEYIDEAMAIENGTFTVDRGSDERIYTVQSSTFSGWRIVGVSYVNEFVDNVEVLWMYYGIFSLLALILASLVSSYVAKTISSPVKTLKDSMEEIRNRNLDSEVQIDSQNEIGDLSQTFNEMTTEIKSLIEDKTSEQKLKRKSELKALQAQINPHFLYNTLDSIIWMAVENRNDEVVEMTSALAKMYRLSISKGEELITVKEEMNHIKNYLIIQKFRYGDKIDYNLEFDQSILDKKILKILLQPLVENSIYHGLKNKIGKGKITIKAYEENKHLIFKVIDDGVGMKPSTLENIMTIQSKNGNGVGVSNVDERIKLYFGQSYGIKYESEIEEGTTATIKIPSYERGTNEL